jgi:hypothetical protein
VKLLFISLRLVLKDQQRELNQLLLQRIVGKLCFRDAFNDDLQIPLQLKRPLCFATKEARKVVARKAQHVDD